MRILSALALAMAATTQAQAFSNDCSLSFNGLKEGLTARKGRRH